MLVALLSPSRYDVAVLENGRGRNDANNAAASLSFPLKQEKEEEEEDEEEVEKGIAQT